MPSSKKPSVSMGRNLPIEEERELENDADYQATLQEQSAENQAHERLNARPQPNPSKSKDRGENIFVLEELGQIAPVIPHKWADVEQDKWIYRSPRQEYVESPFPIDMATLAFRWQGYWEQLDIELAFIKENWLHERTLFQEERERIMFEKSLDRTKEYQTRVLNQDIDRMNLLLEKLMADFLAGWEYRPVRGAGAFAYVRMPLTVDARMKLAKMIKELSQFRGVRVGLFSDLVGSYNKHEHTVTEELRQAQADQNPAYTNLLKLAGIDPNGILTQSQINALPQARIVDSHVEMPDVQEAQYEEVR